MKVLFALSVLFFFQISWAQTTYPAATFESPRATFFYFVKTMKGHKLGDDAALDLAVRALDLSKLDVATRSDSGRLAAKRLINTIDRIAYIDFEKVPGSLKSNKWVWRQSTVVIDDESHDVEISITKNKDGKWLFSPATVGSINHYYQAVKNKPVVKGVVELVTWRKKIKRYMPAWTGKKSFILMNGQWIGIFLIIFLSFIFERFVRLYISWFVSRILERRQLKISDESKKKFTFPLGVITFAGSWIIGVRFLELSDTELAFFLRGGYVAFTVGCVLTAYHIVDVFSLFLEKKAQETENKFDDILVPLVRKSSKFFVVMIGIVFIGDSLTLDMKSILAGLGIGGLAFALAAKDTLGNLFGSLTILLDRPFQIGDYVTINGNISGIVEEVGMRSCRIRTLYDSLITLPNGQLTNAHIDNLGKRTYRRLNTKISLQYDTPPEKIEAFCEGVRIIIENHEWTRKENYHVYLNDMAASSLDILVYVFWRVPNWGKELEEKHRLFMDILKLGHKLGVEFAFPTQTLHMIPGEAARYDSIPAGMTFHEYAKQEAMDVLGKNV